ncbi:hypothetical protein ACN4EG_17775, partial [Alkalinema pantanalense CENA528]|uniref:hypothetical protein n=1 Tax=Alkalinema pantanalense TaxID=1620705 RepID=UPI003D6E1F37
HHPTATQGLGSSSSLHRNVEGNILILLPPALTGTSLHYSCRRSKDLNTMLQWARTMTWKGIHPIVVFNPNTYVKGISLSKSAMHPDSTCCWVDLFLEIS